MFYLKKTPYFERSGAPEFWMSRSLLVLKIQFLADCTKYSYSLEVSIQF